MIRRLVALFAPSYHDRLELAIAAAAKRKGEVEAAGVEVHYYSALLNDCDPYEQWWEYAMLRQKLQDARDDHLRAYKLSVEAEAAVNALMREGTVRA